MSPQRTLYPTICPPLLALYIPTCPKSPYFAALTVKFFLFTLRIGRTQLKKNSSRTNLLSYNIRTITFLHHGGNGDIRYYTYVLSVGIKGGNFEEVQKILTRDLAELTKIPHLFYSGHHSGSFWATVNLVAGVRDRPARGETFFVGIHSHAFGKRFRYSLYHDVNTKILSCKSCHNRRIRRIRTECLGMYSLSTSHGCVVCADLDYTAKEVLKVDITYMENKSKGKAFLYPKVLAPNSPTPPISRPIGNLVSHLTR